MSWLNLNQSLNNIKGQLTSFASEVLSEGPVHDSGDVDTVGERLTKDLEDKCRKQEFEIATLKKQNEELQAALQTEKFSRKNDVKEDDASWYWDPPSQASKIPNINIEEQYRTQIRHLQDELSALKDEKPSTAEDKAELERLREENRNLTSDLEDLDQQRQTTVDMLLSLKNELDKNFEILKEEHKALKLENEQNTSKIERLLAENRGKEKEIDNLKSIKSEYETISHKYHNLERVYSVLKENAEKFQEENQDLNEENFKLQEQVTKLEHDLETVITNCDYTETVPKSNYEHLLKELNELKDRRNANQVHMNEINIDDNAKSVIESLKREIHELNNKLAYNAVNQDHYQSVKSDKIMQLYNKYVNFELPLDYVGEIPSSGDVLIFKLESVFKTVNSFKKEIDALKHKNVEKELNINHLKTQIEVLTSENDFLTSDLQHFERELNEMKKNNDFLINEITTLKNTSKLEPIIETHEDNLAKLETELADCNRQNKTFESEIKKIEKELSTVIKEKSLLQASLTDLKDKYSVLLNELEIFKTQSRAIEELENSTSTQSHAEVKKYQDEIDELKKRISVSNTKNEQLLIDLHIIENDKVLLTNQVENEKQVRQEKDDVIKELQTVNNTLQHKLKDVEIKLEKVQKDCDENKNIKVNLENQISLLKNQLLQFDREALASEQEKLLTEKLLLSERLEQSLLEVVSLKDEMKELSSKVSTLQNHNEKLSNENNTLTSSEKQLQLLIEELNSKLVSDKEVNALKDEIANLNNINQQHIKKKLELETELVDTDKKIVNLEQDFEKLINDLNDKDTIIDSLNQTLVQNDVSLKNMNQNVVDLENTVNIKNKELEKLQNQITELSLHAENQISNASQIEELINDKRTIENQVVLLNETLITKEKEISVLQENLTKMYDNLKVSEENINKLSHSAQELSEKVSTVNNSTVSSDEYEKLLKEKEMVTNEVIQLKDQLASSETQIRNIELKSQELENSCKEYIAALEAAKSEKAELINLVTLKHNESLQYHNEIQRLNHILVEQADKLKTIIEEKESIHDRQNICTNCENLTITLKEKDNIIMTLNQKSSEFEEAKEELTNTSTLTNTLSAKCDELEKTLQIQLENVRRLTAENLQLSEKEQNSTKELERLRHHLVETEDNYTKELMSSEQKLNECQTALQRIEERAKHTTNLYTSNSIRANQEVETLRNQIKLLEKQREDAQVKLSEADDARSRSEAALTNLQVVIEQFQIEKERDVQAATEKIRNKMADAKRQNESLQREVDRLNKKLEESLAGLQAATRLGDQVETKSAQINDLKEQVRALQSAVVAAEERYHNAVSNQQDKVDKNLVKNLVVNYVVASGDNHAHKTQILRVLSTVLDFNQQECTRLDLIRPPIGDSLAAEFVKFLQAESRPRPAPVTVPSVSPTPTPSRRSSTMGPNLTPYELGHKRNTSTSSNNLLFQNIDKVETSSQISIESDRPGGHLETGVNQTRNTESAILKHVLKDI